MKQRQLVILLGSGLLITQNQRCHSAHQNHRSRTDLPSQNSQISLLNNMEHKHQTHVRYKMVHSRNPRTVRKSKTVKHITNYSPTVTLPPPKWLAVPSNLITQFIVSKMLLQTAHALRTQVLRWLRIVQIAWFLLLWSQWPVRCKTVAVQDHHSLAFDEADPIHHISFSRTVHGPTH